MTLKINFSTNCIISGNGEIDLQEFMVVMSRKVSASYSAEQVKNSFREFQSPDSKDSFITSDELISALTTYGTVKLSHEEAAKLVAQV